MEETLTINEDGKKEFFIKGATEEIIYGESDVIDKLRKGEGKLYTISDPS